MKDRPKNPAAVALGRKGGKKKSERKAAAAYRNGLLGGRPAHRYFILHRTGGVYSTFEGSRDEAEAHCAALNKHDAGGSTTIHSGHATAAACDEEFWRLTDQ